MNTDRNWLIRTTQNQILGPINKTKVLEFLEKGALGPNDEVTSGNGFWFSLKEKDLVDKYLFGDIPQGYNPISEAKSVLAKREHPDKTSSLNMAPVNKLQTVKDGLENQSVIPKTEDLEYPDITFVNPIPSLVNTPKVQTDTRLPSSEDLEFPDITIVGRPIQLKETHSINLSEPQKDTKKANSVENKIEDKIAIYPNDDDLSYPEISTNTETPLLSSELEKELDIQVILAAASQKELHNSEMDLTYVMNKNEINEKTITSPKMGRTSTSDSLTKEEKKSPSSVQSNYQPEKLLHERKVKSTTPSKDKSSEIPKAAEPRSMPDDLKKRNDNYLLFILAIIILIILGLFFYYYRNILNKPLPV